jgi:hypothetical protein
MRSERRRRDKQKQKKNYRNEGRGVEEQQVVTVVPWSRVGHGIMLTLIYLF